MPTNEEQDTSVVADSQRGIDDLTKEQVATIAGADWCDDPLRAKSLAWMLAQVQRLLQQGRAGQAIPVADLQAILDTVEEWEEAHGIRRE